MERFNLSCEVFKSLSKNVKSLNLEKTHTMNSAGLGLIAICLERNIDVSNYKNDVKRILEVAFPKLKL